MSRLPVSAIVLTFNEQKKIARCLESLAWADEILVVDGQSTDQTRSICEEPGRSWSGKVRVLQRAWTGFKDQRNYSLEQARYDWVLVVDADEICTPELAARVQEMLGRTGGPEKRAYKVHRQEFFFGKRIFYGMWSPCYQDRFFDRRGVQYVNEVHEYPVFAEPPGRIEEALLHLADITIERYFDKLNRYTSLEAQDRYHQGQRTTLFKLVGAFPAHFYKSLIYYKAYRDGMHGVVISLLEGVSRLARQLKIWQAMQLETRSATQSQALAASGSVVAPKHDSRA